MDEADTFVLEFLLTLVLLFFLLFFSIIASTLHRLTPFDLKLLNEQHGKKSNIFNLLAHNNLKVIIPISFGIQTSLLFIFILTTHMAIQKIDSHPLLWAFGILLVVSLIFCQFVPRLLVHVNPEKKLLRLLPLLSILFPVVKFFSYPIISSVERMRGSTKAADDDEPEVMDKKIQALIAIGKEEEVLEKEDSELVKSVIEFGDTKALEVMIPRSQIIALPENASIKEAKDLMVRTKHSRIPVYRENLDQIIGVIYVRNLLTMLEEKEWDSPINDLLIPPVFVTEEERISEVFKEMKAKRSWMVFVKNEYGGVSGLITIEDLLEEIVGDIDDEDQTKQSEIVPQGKNLFLVSGKAGLYELSEALGVTLADDDCQTIGGFITKTIGRLPKKNDRVEVSGLVITILNVDSRKINRLLVEKPAELKEDPQGPIKKGTSNFFWIFFLG
jgi:CBS domain containing-hemolysin-like protein